MLQGSGSGIVRAVAREEQRGRQRSLSGTPNRLHSSVLPRQGALLGVHRVRREGLPLPLLIAGGREGKETFIPGQQSALLWS